MSSVSVLNPNFVACRGDDCCSLSWCCSWLKPVLYRRRVEASFPGTWTVVNKMPWQSIVGHPHPEAVSENRTLWGAVDSMLFRIVGPTKGAARQLFTTAVDEIRPTKAGTLARKESPGSPASAETRSMSAQPVSETLAHLAALSCSLRAASALFQRSTWRSYCSLVFLW